MQITLALVATFAAVSARLAGAPVAWLVGAFLIFAVIPFTVLATMPTNKILLDPARDRSSEHFIARCDVGEDFTGVRSVLALLSSMVLLGSLILQSSG